MTRLLITGIAELFTGDLDDPIRADTELLIEDGIVEWVGAGPTAPDRVIDAQGGAVLPGLVDGHVHPSFGQWTPAQNAIGWMSAYLHGGTTTMVSAGELHIPGLPLDELTPELVTSLAVVSRETTGRFRPDGLKLHAGTVLLVPGMTVEHFDRLAAHDCRFAKFIFYPWADAPEGEAERYVQWCRERGIGVKVHTGGVSRSGASRPTGYAELARVQPDVAAHVSGGPIPMSDDDLDRVVDDLACALEVCSSMNYRSTLRCVRRLAAIGRLDRLTLGTDTPGGTGVIPRGMLRNVLLLASVCDLPVATAVAVATGNTAKAHQLDVGILAAGRPADLVVCGRVRGSSGPLTSDAIAHGDLPGISHVVVDGIVRVDGRSEQTPPPELPATTADAAHGCCS